MKVELWKVQYNNKFNRTHEIVVNASNPIQAIKKALAKKPLFDDSPEYKILLNKIISVEFIAQED